MFRIRISKFLGHQDPDPLIKGTDQDLDLDPDSVLDTDSVLDPDSDLDPDLSIINRK